MRLICLLIFFLLSNNIISKDSISSESKKNVYKLVLAEGVVLGGIISYLQYEWYSDKQRVPFHFYNDFKGWNQVDKLGHFYAAYLQSNIGYSILKKNKISEKKSLLYGGFQGLILQTPIEFFDAYYKGWGFSISDMIANALGSLFFIAQQKIFDNQIIKPKMSFSRTLYAKNANGYLGKNNIFSEFAYDYNGHTYWFSFSPNEVFKLNRIPKWINLSFGYGSNGMIGEFENKTFFRGNPIPEFKRYKQIYLSLDIDFSKIKSKTKFGKKLLNVLSYIKVPLPTLEFSNKKLKGHLFYF